MDEKTLVIVESPAKAKSINRYLGSDYKVLASFGHVRDLSPKEGSVNPDDDFSMVWEVDSASKKRVSDIARALKTSDRLILATDPDREGEAISWHLLEILKAQRGLLKDKTVERITFNAITKTAILEAIKQPRTIDQPLIDAYLTRRALDYLVGYSLSPVLWRKLPGARSAGRVQSVALRLVCDREEAIEAFVREDYWSLVVNLLASGDKSFQARLVGVDGEKLDKLSINSEAMALGLKARLEQADYRIESVESKPARRFPYAPFTTSTLQQEASRKLRFGSARTMQIAQQLYEGIDLGGETTGLITYMRTDGVQMAPEAINSLRDEIQTGFGKDYVPKSARVYTSKAKNAQEAHEAIRPTDIRRHPKTLWAALNDDQWKLYDLIWRRTLASQMEAARFERTTVTLQARDEQGYLDLRASGQVLQFDGFLTLYRESVDDPTGDEEETSLPAISKEDQLKRNSVDMAQHTTEPPPRYTEASLIRAMEEIGIGRPSTYTSTLSTLKDRGYVVIDKNRLLPEDKGRLVTAFLTSFFNRYVEYDFTADLEEKLDEVSRGELLWKNVLRDFWQGFSARVGEARELEFTEVIDRLNDLLANHVFPPRSDGTDPRACTLCEGGQLSIKLGKFGSFVGCSNYPDCRYTRPLGAGESDGEAEAALSDQRDLGKDDAGLEVSVRKGRFGPYFQAGEGKEARRMSVPKSLDWMSVDLETALKYLSLPREVGLHPETNEMITSSIGRYGPYIHHKSTYVNLPTEGDVFTVGINHAVSLLAEKAAGRRAPTAQILASLGEHPEKGGEISVRSGRYGPYVTHDKVNASLPRGKDPAALTQEEAIQLLDARIAAGGGKKATGKTTAKRATARKKSSTKS